MTCTYDCTPGKACSVGFAACSATMAASAWLLSLIPDGTWSPFDDAKVTRVETWHQMMYVG